MRLHRFFVEEQLRNKKEVTLYEENIIHQLKDVFRLRAGDRVIFLDNSGFEYLSEIVLIAKGKLEIKVLEATAALNIPEKEIWLFAALVKKDNYEWVIEKCTELGVSHFVPVISERSEKKDLNMERAEKIIKEASEQSGRGVMPILHDIVDLKDSFNLSEMPQKLLVFNTEGEKFNREILTKQSSLEKSLNISQDKISYGIFIGPEGGWTEKEIELFKSKNIPIYSLGNQVLRAETAAIAVSGLLLL